MSENKKPVRTEQESSKLSQLDMLLGLVCAIFFVDTIASVATMGAAAVTWIVIVGALFFFPGSLTVAELGSAYPENGGFYAWIKRAFGNLWGARISWIYWSCNAIWISSVATLVVTVFCQVFHLEISNTIAIFFNIAVIWLMVFVATRPMDNSQKIINFSAIAKLCLGIGLVIAAILYLMRNDFEFANPITLDRFVPTFGQSIVFIPALIYNFLGFESMSAAGSAMENPGRDVPRAALKNCLLVSGLYIVTVLSMLAIIPIGDISIIQGLVDCFRIGFGNSFVMNALVYGIGAVFVTVLFCQGMMWILTVCRVSAETALTGELPRIFAKTHKNGSPIGSLVIAGFVASAMTLVASSMSGSAEEMFWSIFSCTSFLLLIPYLLNFEAFLKLRRTDKTTVRPYIFPGPSWFAVLMVRIGEFIILATMFLFIWVPGTPFNFKQSMFVLIGIVLTLAAGELITRSCMAKYRKSTDRNDVDNWSADDIEAE